MKRSAFTLAEVLITLGIIGVVAAMTMPALIANHQKNVTLTQLQKAYSEISQALKMAETENGFSNEWDFSELPAGKERGDYFHKNYLAKYLKTVKDCYPTSNECWGEVVSMSGTAGYLENSDDFRSSVSASGYSIYSWISASNEHAQIWVDIDGPLKGKNMLGRDVFGMVLYFKDVSSAEGLHRRGLNLKGADFEPLHSRDELKNDRRYGCSRDINHVYAGHNCGAIIQMDGWKISDDYPWK